MNREELIHVAVCQWLLVLATVVSSAFFGWNAALSGLVWPAMIFGIIAAAVSVFLLPIFNH